MIYRKRNNRVTRRTFLKGIGAGVVAVPWIVPGSALGLDGTVSPANRTNVALIGRGCMGSGHLHWLVGDPAVQVMAVCDVDKTRREEGRQIVEDEYTARRLAGKGGSCASVNDYREVLARPDIDAVIIATPDHWHSLISIHAARAGKDVYCEKPVSLTIEQGRTLVDVVRRYGRVFQTGTQYRSIPAIRKIVNFVRAGGLGKIKSVFIHWDWVYVPTFGNSRMPLTPVLPEEAVPEGLDWGMWVGPSAWHSYNNSYHRNPIPGVVPWTFCDDFGAGAVTNHHSHSADVIQYAIGMEESGPVEVIHPSSGQFPTMTCRYASGVLVHHVDHWDQVKKLYGAVPESAKLDGSFGGVIVGERGWVTTMKSDIDGGPESIFKEMGLLVRTANVGANNHHENWFQCIKTRARPSAHEEIGHRAASMGHLVALSFKLGRSLKWDPVTERFQGDDEANRLCSRAMREPWRI